MSRPDQRFLADLGGVFLGAGLDGFFGAVAFAALAAGFAFAGFGFEAGGLEGFAGALTLATALACVFAGAFATGLG